MQGFGLPSGGPGGRLGGSVPVELGSGLCQAWLNEGVRSETLGEAGWADAQIREPPWGRPSRSSDSPGAGSRVACGSDRLEFESWLCGNLGQGLNLSEPQFPRLQNGTGHACIVKL